MGRYILKRLLWMIPVIIGVTILIFTIMYSIPGEPVSLMLGPEATHAQIAAKRQALGLNDPYLVRLGRFVGGIVLHFDFGDSWVYHTPVTTELLHRLPRTLTIAALCIAMQVLLGIPLGIIAAVKQDTWIDRIAMFTALFGISMPNFWIALMLVLLFSVRLGWLPPYGISGWQYYVLPVVANGFVGVATQARQTRSSMLEVIRSDYIVTARAKGMSEFRVLLRHALPNALLPVITVIGNGMGRMLAGTVVIESIFSIPGVGMYLVGGINSRDYAVVQSSVIFLAMAFTLVMLLVDLAYAFIDPRIKAQFAGRKRRKQYA
ncbi:MAG TPA: ABC transporter permease [Anaerolineae bacterium]|nr:ABC transporter permease [Anaerolineae bacterium]HOR00555.1 ABC transporter permease [Anaerolineae bacterium]